MKKIAIIAAHPDDEALGCGGTIIKHKKNGDEIHILFMTDGISARKNPSKIERDERIKGINKAKDFLKPASIDYLNFPDNKLDSVPLLEITQSIENFLSKIKADKLYTHFSNDLNVDHQITCKACITATRPGSITFVKEIYSFEVPSSTEWKIGTPFNPQCFIDISSEIHDKEKLLECYASEMRDRPHPRSIKNAIALNQIRGSQVCLSFAEAFEILRKVDS